MHYIIPGLVTFAAGFLSGLILWLIKRDRLSLDYEMESSEPFPRDTGVGRFFSIKISNSGNRPVQAIDFSISFQSGQIDSTKLSNSKLVSNMKQKKSDYSGVIPLLNPNEHLAVIITVIGTSDISPPHIMARAVGVTAIPKEDAPLFNRKNGAIPWSHRICLRILQKMQGPDATNVRIYDGSGSRLRPQSIARLAPSSPVKS
jgi:hypothetical protein